jgi:hypothetical protein
VFETCSRIQFFVEKKKTFGWSIARAGEVQKFFCLLNSIFTGLKGVQKNCSVKKIAVSVFLLLKNSALKK